jgi:hypothetical protein
MCRLAEIIQTYINGNITVAKNEFRYWRIDLIQVVQCSELFGIRQTIKICKEMGLSDMYIINSFHNYDRQNIDEAKEILLNNFY